MSRGAVKLQTEKIEVSAEIARLIRRRAEAQGMSVDDYLQALTEIGASDEEVMSEAEIQTILDELAADVAKTSRPFQTISRAKISILSTIDERLCSRQGRSPAVGCSFNRWT